MKRLFWIATIVLAVPALARAGTTCMQRSQDLLAALKAGHYTAAAAHFDPQVEAAVPADKLKALWETVLPLQFGKYEPVAKGQVASAESSNIIVTPLHFANGWLDMKVACDANMAIAGLRFLPGKAPPGSAPTSVRRIVSGAWGISKPTQVASPLGPLPATLTLPYGKGPFAAVLLIGGSGAHDRDESIGPNKPFRDIARGLAAHGIASLRYDKRTFAYAARMSADRDLTIDDEVTDDALSAAHQLGATAGIDPHRVFVLGHSLGAMMAPRIGKRDPQLAGLVLMAAPARSLLAVSAWQVRELGSRMGMTSKRVAANEAAIRHEQKRLATADGQRPFTGSFGGVPQSYWLSLRDYHQVAEARSLMMPMLILQGADDFQVSPKLDFDRWKQDLHGETRVTFRLYPGLSHLFMSAGKTGTLADYRVPGKVASRVIADIASWIKAQPAR